MNPVFFWPHFVAGLAAILLGTVAMVARKGGRVHVSAGTGFAVAMLVLGVTATILARLKVPTESGLGGLLTCYFVATSWVAARRRDGTTGKFEIIACIAILVTAALMAWGGFTAAETTPVGSGPIFALAATCLIAGLLDLNVILRRKISAAQRFARHLWRMCFAFFIATGSFFLGQQDVMPAVVQGSPILFVLAFAPLAVMVFWLVRVRFGKRFRSARPPVEAPVAAAA